MIVMFDNNDKLCELADAIVENDMMSFNSSLAEEIDVNQAIYDGYFDGTSDVETGLVQIDGHYDGMTALMIAVLNNRFEMAEQLLTHGAEIDFHEDTAGDMTALMQASQCRNQEAMRFLIKHGASPVLINKNNESALTISLASYDYCEQKEIDAKSVVDNFNVLLAGRTEKDRVDALNQKLIQLSKEDTNIDDEVKFILSLGANINFQDQDGNTALHYTVTNDGFSENNCRVLLCNGASILIKNNDGQTALMVYEAIEPDHSNYIQSEDKFLQFLISSSENERLNGLIKQKESVSTNINF